MPLQQINLGTVANDGTGDDIRTAFQKVIFNFNELNSRTPEATTVVNLGSGQGLFANKDDAELRFKSLVAGQNVTLAANGETITVNVNAGVTQFTVEADAGSLLVTENSNIKIEGGRLVTTERIGDSIVVNSNALSSVADDPNPTLSAGLNAAGFPLGNVGAIDATTVSGIFNGNLTGLVHGVDIRDLNFYRVPNNSWDFNGIAPTPITNIFDWVFQTTDVDFGSIGGVQVNKTLDFGSIVV